MSPRKLFFSSALAATLLVPLAAGATPSEHGKDCALRSYKVTQVAPYRVQERTGRGTIQRLAGAKIFVAAQPGLTAEWLSTSLKRHLAQMQTGSMPDCPLDVDRISVSVASGGTGFWVQIAGKNPAAAKEILARAQHLVH